MPNKLSQLNCWMLSCSTNVWGVLVILSLQHFIMIRKYKGPKCNNTTEKPVWKLVFYSTSYTYQPLLSVPFPTFINYFYFYFIKVQSVRHTENRSKSTFFCLLTITCLDLRPRFLSLITVILPWPADNILSPVQ